MAPHPGRGSPSLQAPVAMGSTASDRLNFEANAKNASTIFGLSRAKTKEVQGLAVEARGRDGEPKRAHGRQAFSPIKDTARAASTERVHCF